MATRPTVRARAVVNATGVWADDVRALDEGVHPATIRPAKGVHITLPWERVRNTAAAIVPSAHDKRSVFVIPWEEHTYVGTTDTDYHGPLDEPRCTDDDADYLLDALNGVTTVKATSADIVGSWAGLRPLLAAGAPRPQRRPVAPTRRARGAERRRHRHRREAHHLSPHGRRRGRRRGRACSSTTRRIRPRSISGCSGATASIRDTAEHDHLVGRYGSEAAAVPTPGRRRSRAR